MGDFPSLRTREALSPLRRFKGTLSAITKEEEQGDRGTYLRLQFGFTEVEVIETLEPYPFPTAQIGLSVSKSADTRWDAFGKSVLKATGDVDDLNLLVGHKQEWAMLPAMLRQPLVDADGNPIIQTTGRGAGRQAWGDMPTDCWQVVSVDGYSGAADPTPDILTMLEGKTDTEFHQAFQSSELARTNVALMTENVNRQLLPRLEAEGRASRSADGIWHVVTK